MKGTGRRADIRLLFHDTRGATAVEYGLILALIILAVISGVTALGDSVHGLWGNISDRVSAI